MPTYQVRGEVPRKRHVQFRDNGRLMTEEVMGLEGFAGNESILYHLTSPCRVTKVADFEPIKRDEWVPDGHAHRHFRTMGIDPDGDAVNGRQLLMWNDDVEISLCRPDTEMDYFFRNGEGDEVIFVHEGSGTLETIFGELPYKEGDYVVVPRGTTYRFRPEGEQRYLVFESPGLIEIPRRYRNDYGQLLEHAPFYHPLSIPIPYHHTNLNSEEMIYYVSGNFSSRRGIDVGSVTLHPSGIPHGPHPGLAEKSIGQTETHELAVMCDTFHPLRLTKLAKKLDDGQYAYSWLDEGAPAAESADEDPAGVTSHF